MCAAGGASSPGPATGRSAWPPGRVVDALRAAGCVFAEEEARVLVQAATDDEELAAMVQARVEGKPLEYIVGWVEFGGLRIAVDEGVFVPRRRSELLVREAVSQLVARPAPVLVDLCCGCGAIGMAIAAAVDAVRLHAADIDPIAVRCARRNLDEVGGTVHEGDLFDALPDALRGLVDLLVVNAPYVPTAAIALMPPEARDHEPAVALDGGPDGTDVLRRVIAGASGWLAPDAVLLVEVGASQIPLISSAFEIAGLVPSIVTDDEIGGMVAVGRS